MIKSPTLQRVIGGVLIGMDPRSGRNEGLDEGANRGLLDIFDPPGHDGVAALDRAENRRLFRRQGLRGSSPGVASSATTWEVTLFLEFRGYSSLEYPKYRNKNFYFCTHNPIYYIAVWDTETYWFEGKTHV